MAENDAKLKEALIRATGEPTFGSALLWIQRQHANLAAPDAAKRDETTTRFLEHFITKVEPFYEKKHGKLPPEEGALWELLMFVQRELDAVRQARRKTCVWSLDDATDSSLWETDCGQAFQFNDEGPEENHFRFCYYCGNPLEALRRTESDEVDEAAALRAEGER